MTAAEGRHGTSYDRVVAAITAVSGDRIQQGSGYIKVCCPAHDDRTPSCEIRYDAAKGKTRVWCYSCNDDEAVLHAAGLRVADLFDAPLDPAGRSSRRQRSTNGIVSRAPEFSHTGSPEPQRTPVAPSDDEPSMAWVCDYVYTDAAGAKVGKVQRYDLTLHGSRVGKTFRQKRFDPDTRRWRNGHFDPVLYRAPQVADAITNGSPVYLVEGEKDADTAAAMELTGTTNAQGAANFTAEHAEQLRGAQVILVCDRDTAGYRRALALRDLLGGEQGIVASLRTVDPAEGKDLTDHRHAGRGVGELADIDPAVRFCEQAPVEAAADMAERAQLLEAGDIQRAEKKLRGVRRLLEEARGTLEQAPAAERDRLAAELDKLTGAHPELGGDAAAPDPEAQPQRSRATAQGRRPGSGNVEPTYALNDHQVVEIERKPGKDGDERLIYRTLLRCEAWVSATLTSDSGEEVESPETEGWRVQLRRPVLDDDGAVVVGEDGEPEMEAASVVLSQDARRDGSWTDLLPWPGLVVDLSRKGKDKCLSAIQTIRQRGNQVLEPIYTATGWRNTANGWIFIHAGGAIGADGPVDVLVKLPDKLQVLEMSRPTADRDELRELWRDGVRPLLELPPRIAAPLMGAAFRSMLDRLAATVHVEGDPGSGKTAMARCAGGHFITSRLAERGRGTRRELLSGVPKIGDSGLGMLRTLGAARNCLCLCDDFKTSAAVQQLELLQQAIYNGVQRTTASRTPSGTHTAAEIHAGVVTTGEVGTSGSAATRTLVIGVGEGDLGSRPRDLFQALEAFECRDARARIGASFVQWAAGDYAALAKWVEDLEGADAAGYGAYWSEVTDRLGQFGPGIRDRYANIATALTTGWAALIRFGRSRGVMSARQADWCWQWAMRGLREVLTAQDPDAADGPRQLLDGLRSAMASERGHLGTRSGAPPSAAAEDLKALGWRSRMIGGDPASPEYTGQGEQLGVLDKDNDRVLLFPKACLSAVRSAADRAGDSWSHTSSSLGKAMAGRGWIRPAANGDNQRAERVGGSVVKVWVMPRPVFFGEDQGPEVGPDTPDPDLPAPPHRSGPEATDPPPAPEDVADESNVVRPEHWQDHADDEDITPHGDDDSGDAGAGNQPCLACGQPSGYRHRQRPLHYCCPDPDTGITPAAADAQAETAATDAEAPQAPTAGEGEEAQLTLESAEEPSEEEGPAEAGALQPLDPVEVNGPRPPAPEGHGAACAVLDPTGVYLPDGARYALPPLTDALDVLELGEQLRLGHPGGPGQLLLTDGMCLELGLVAEADPGLVGDHARQQIVDRLGELGQAFLTRAREAGWDIEALRVENRARRRHRALDIVLAPYEHLWSRGRDDSHPMGSLPEELAPEQYAAESARFMGYLAHALGVPWRSSGVQVGWDLFDRAQRQRSRRANGHVVSVPAPLPELTGGTQATQLAPTLTWSRWSTARTARDSERTWLSERRYAVHLDRTAAWLASARAEQVGYLPESEPQLRHVSAGGVAELLDGGKPPAGLYRLRLPAHTHPALPPLHPDQAPDHARWLWVTAPTARALLAEDDPGVTFCGLGCSPAELTTDDDTGEAEAWIFPASGLLLGGPWGDTLRDARYAARDAGDAASEDMIKRVYSGMLQTTLHTSARVKASTRGWHHQPAWLPTVQAHHYAWQHNLIRRAHYSGLAVASAQIDEVVLLVDDPADAALGTMGAPPKVGQYKVKLIRELTDEHRARLAAGTPAHELTGGEQS